MLLNTVQELQELLAPHNEYGQTQDILLNYQFFCHVSFVTLKPAVQYISQPVSPVSAFYIMWQYLITEAITYKQMSFDAVMKVWCVAYPLK